MNSDRSLSYLRVIQQFTIYLLYLSGEVNISILFQLFKTSPGWKLELSLKQNGKVDPTTKN